MPARWMEAKRAKMKPMNMRFIVPGSIKEAVHCETRQAELPQAKHTDDQTIEAYYARGGRVRREPCKGRMPHHSYGRKCKGHSRAGLNLNPTSERAMRERVWDFAPKGLINWAPVDRPCTLIKR